jgi:hypothetical protein
MPFKCVCGEDVPSLGQQTSPCDKCHRGWSPVVFDYHLPSQKPVSWLARLYAAWLVLRGK